MIREITLPRIGQDIFEARVTEIRVQKGDRLQRDDVYMEVATDKVDIELPMPFSGMVLEIGVEVRQMVVMNQVLLVVDTVEDTDLITREERGAHVQVGLRYLASKDPAILCKRPELGSHTFEEFQSFVEKVVALAKEFSRFSLDALDDEVTEDLAGVLYYVTSLVTELEGFDPVKLGFRQFQEYQRIRWFVGINQDEALRQFRRALAVVGIKQDETPTLSFTNVQRGLFEDEGAYVFISYSHFDKDFAVGFAERLNLRRIRFFLDVKSIGFGGHITGIVHQDLSRASHVIPLISAASVQSQWVAYEVGYARGKGVAVVPYAVYPGIQLPQFISQYRYLLPEEEAVFLDQLEAFGRK